MCLGIASLISEHFIDPTHHSPRSAAHCYTRLVLARGVEEFPSSVIDTLADYNSQAMATFKDWGSSLAFPLEA
eukprot:1101743-Amphidinium_carterae.1